MTTERKGTAKRDGEANVAASYGNEHLSWSSKERSCFVRTTMGHLLGRGDRTVDSVHVTYASFCRRLQELQQRLAAKLTVTVSCRWPLCGAPLSTYRVLAEQAILKLRQIII
ncbi:hypothetical protein Trydic_g16699 [Trypoxylus dichotomus]